jgi:hypothetical protein
MNLPIEEKLFSTPEELLEVAATVGAGVQVDAINAACERASAVLSLISGQFLGDGSARFSDQIISSAIWDVQGTIEQIKKIVSHTARGEGGAV